jgi:hypothetical protein
MGSIAVGLGGRSTTLPTSKKSSISIARPSVKPEYLSTKNQKCRLTISFWLKEVSHHELHRTLGVSSNCNATHFTAIRPEGRSTTLSSKLDLFEHKSLPI